jgi:hypothetical protein
VLEYRYVHRLVKCRNVALIAMLRIFAQPPGESQLPSASESIEGAGPRPGSSAGDSDRDLPVLRQAEWLLTRNFTGSGRSGTH